MKSFVEEFYRNFKGNYSRMTKTHRSLLRSLKNHRTHPANDVCSPSVDWPAVSKQGFFNETYEGETSSSTEKLYQGRGALLY